MSGYNLWFGGMESCHSTCSGSGGGNCCCCCYSGGGWPCPPPPFWPGVIAPPFDDCDAGNKIPTDRVYCPPADFCGRTDSNVINPPFPSIPGGTAQNCVWWPQWCPSVCGGAGGGGHDEDDDAESVCYVIKKAPCKKNTQASAPANSAFYPGYSPWSFIVPKNPNNTGFTDEWTMESSEHGIIASLGANTSLDDFIAGCNL